MCQAEEPARPDVEGANVLERTHLKEEDPEMKKSKQQNRQVKTEEKLDDYNNIGQFMDLKKKPFRDRGPLNCANKFHFPGKHTIFKLENI